MQVFLHPHNPVKPWRAGQMPQLFMCEILQPGLLTESWVLQHFVTWVFSLNPYYHCYCGWQTTWTHLQEEIGSNTPLTNSRQVLSMTYMCTLTPVSKKPQRYIMTSTQSLNILQFISTPAGLSPAADPASESWGDHTKPCSFWAGCPPAKTSSVTLTFPPVLLESHRAHSYLCIGHC